MKAKHSKGNVVRTWKKILGLVGVASLTLVCTGVAWSQAQPTQTESTAARAVPVVTSASSGTQSPSAPPATNQVMAQNLPAKPSAQKGQSEGIKVHGHWTIEVHNPDGKLVTHREFENSLASNLNGGAALLTAILGRTVTTGSWQVFLYSISQNNAVIINEPNSEAAAACPNFVADLEEQVGDVASCSNNLNLSGPTGSGPALRGNTLTLMGSGTVPQGFPSSIGYVQTLVLACATTDSPTACFNDPNFLSAFALTQRTLDGLNGDPVAVPVTAGQTVQVTVVISFQ